MKKLLILIICFQISLMPLLCINEFSFAESGGGGAGGDAWIAVTDEDTMVASFKAYCRTRNFNKTFTYSDGLASEIAKVIIKYDYDQIEKLCALTGIDIDTLNAGLWYKIDQNNILKFFYTSAAMRLLNQLYSALLTEHGIQENDTKNLYSGRWFETDEGNGCFMYSLSKDGSINQVYNSTASFKSNVSIGTRFTEKGSYYYSIYPLNTEIPFTFTKFNNTYSYHIKCGYLGSGFDRKYTILSNFNAGFNSKTCIYWSGIYDGNYDGYGIILYNTFDQKTWLCNYTTDGTNYNITSVFEISGNFPEVNVNANQGEFNTEPENKSMEVQTDSDTINNFITNNNSNVTNNYYDDDNPPSPPPYTNPYDDNPTGGTIGGDGSINFQMPDLNIDWNLGLNVENLPFPFSIPFDFNNALKMLDVEPETPRFQGTITIPYINYDWEIDLDFGKYDEYESLINMFQKVFLFGYVISLILATRAVMHIY